MLANGCGVSFYEYYKMKSNMLNSIKDNGGFWIGRYETGAQNATKLNKTRNSESGTDDEAVIQANKIPYNYVTCSQAQELAKKMNKSNEYTTSLLFGIQWDLVCKFLEVRGILSTNDIANDSSKWGNYSNTKINLSRGKYNINPGDKDSVYTAEFNEIASDGSRKYENSSSNYFVSVLNDSTIKVIDVEFNHNATITQICSKQ